MYYNINTGEMRGARENVVGTRRVFSFDSR